MTDRWREVYEREYPRLVRALLASGREPAAAEDAAQEAFVRAHKTGLENIEKLARWLRVVGTREVFRTATRPRRATDRAKSHAMTNERQDDEIIGRALSRAIETIDVNQTPYERSRIAAAPARRSIFGWSQLGFAVVGIILAVALGSWLTRPTE